MNIALFGTSADPPTKGHGKVLAWLSQHYDHVAVWAADNPFKQHQAPLEHRNAMVQTLVDELGCTNLHLHPELSYRRSIMTVGTAQHLWPQAKFTLVIGSDLVGQMPSWYQIQSLLAEVELLVVPRPGTPLDENSLTALRALGAQASIAEMEGLNVSSTAYRDRCIDEVISPAVRDYIHKARLYRCSDRDMIRRLPASSQSTQTKSPTETLSDNPLPNHPSPHNPQLSNAPSPSSPSTHHPLHSACR